MNDRELLELSAKAVGVDLQPIEIKNVTYLGDDRFIGYMVSPEKWPRGWFNPLTDDGDALRLAVQLSLTVYQWSMSECCVCTEDGTINEGVVYKKDPFAATRRAIVLAAAEIGKGMK